MIVGGASCIGESHKGNNIPLQDAFKVFSSARKKYVVAVVADGAGSAKHAEVGAERITEAFETELKKLCDAGLPVSFDGFKETVFFAIQFARRSLVADGYVLNDCHATIVACLIFRDRCFTAHLGDGLQVVLVREPSGAIAACVSEPENGDAVNETFFFTEDSWHEHLRLTEIPKNILGCLLMSDGMEDFVWNSKTGLKFGFCGPLIERAFDGNRVGKSLNEMLGSVVQDPRTNEFTADDKTLCLILEESDPFTFSKEEESINQYVIRDGRPIRFHSVNDVVTLELKSQAERAPLNFSTLDERGDSELDRKYQSNKLGNEKGIPHDNSQIDKNSNSTRVKQERAIKQYRGTIKLLTFFLWVSLPIALLSGYFLRAYEPFMLQVLGIRLAPSAVNASPPPISAQPPESLSENLPSKASEAIAPIIIQAIPTQTPDKTVNELLDKGKSEQKNNSSTAEQKSTTKPEKAEPASTARKDSLPNKIKYTKDSSQKSIEGYSKEQELLPNKLAPAGERGK